MSFRNEMRYMNPYDVHKFIINEYVLQKPGDSKHLRRDTSKDKRDIDVIKENHRFLWNENEIPESWEEEFAKKYYDKLFKEYCIGDLGKYKENKIALRWRIEQEVITGKGQFICGNKICNKKEDLRSWEVNFAYSEKGERRNALVKIRLCPDCSKKLNYHSKKKEIKHLKKRSKTKSTSHSPDQLKDIACNSKDIIEETEDHNVSKNEESLWENLKPIEVKSRDEEMEDYLENLLL